MNIRLTELQMNDHNVALIFFLKDNMWLCILQTCQKLITIFFNYYFYA